MLHHPILFIFIIVNNSCIEEIWDDVKGGTGLLHGGALLVLCLCFVLSCSLIVYYVGCCQVSFSFIVVLFVMFLSDEFSSVCLLVYSSLLVSVSEAKLNCAIQYITCKRNG